MRLCVGVSDLLSVAQLQRQVSQYLAEGGPHRCVDAALVAAGHVGLNTHLNRKNSMKPVSGLTSQQHGDQWGVSMASLVAMVIRHHRDAFSICKTSCSRIKRSLCGYRAVMEQTGTQSRYPAGCLQRHQFGFMLRLRH